MSATSPAVSALGRPGSGAEPASNERPMLRIGAFAGLALFGALRWGALMSPAPSGRLLGLVAIAAAVVVVGPWVSERSRLGAIALAVVAALSMLLVCGLHWEWVRHLRIAVSARAIGTGLDRLPTLLVPYHGTNPYVRLVLLLGAALLLFDAALMLAFAAHPLGQRRAGMPSVSRSPGSGVAGDVRRAIAALPLVALAAVPLTLVPAKFQYAEGAVLFFLLAALVWGERLPRRGAGTAAFVCGLACAAAMVAAPWLDAHKPWIQYQTLATGIGLVSQEDFDWSQTYGPLNWPRDGRDVLEVAAAHADYWTAVDLDSFDGRAWTLTQPALAAPGPDGISRQARARWTESVTVTVAAMTSQYVFGPGELQSPTHTDFHTSSDGPGRWISYTPLGPGDSYVVSGYAPHPSPGQLAAAGTDYPQSIVPEDLQLALPNPPNGGAGAPAVVWPDAFGSPPPVLYQSTFGETQGAALLNASPYARAFALARRLRAAARTPYQYVQSVLRLLSHGYRYDEHPPVTAYPLESFLFTDRRGYCQQFAGAMALLLRLGGVPARVAAGFTSGQYDTNLHRYVVTDYDAHAWVEAFFPHYGWVRFDPTPASADPAQQHSSLGAIAPGSTSTEPQATKAPAPHGLGLPGDSASHGARRGNHRGVPTVLVILAVLAGLGLASVLFITRPIHHQTPEQMLGELERAFRRTGRALPPQLTLTELERRMAGEPGALSYIQAITRARFGAGAARPSPAQRRALRGALASGLGLSGRLRALWALPPRW